ncbi:hypothetical protein FOZ60_001447 [Perkinsus olseni]|uniref:Uncharacterized protein n=1 Tax=Perkinsus olseni TaxID=32597 RepID=A0A7J6PK21_PEROL|nr:hypothetical protein FOZ60_001447 [Perkinsus olseni]
MWSDSSFLPAPFPFTFVAEGHAGTNEANSTSTPTVADMLAPVVRYERLEDDYAGGDYAFESTDGNLSAATSASGMSYDYDDQKEGRTIEWNSGDGDSPTTRPKRKYHELDPLQATGAPYLGVESLYLLTAPKRRTLEQEYR